MKYIKYLNYVFRHKYYVMLECFKRGLYWQGLIHDNSKFRLSELIPYTDHFQGKNKDRYAQRDKSGYYKPTDTGDDAFDFAWLLHQKRNRHHWQWWVLPEDNGGLKILDIPIKYRIEMLCDWMGAGKAQKTNGVPYWYDKNKDKLQLHPNTRTWIESEINKLRLLE